MLEPDESYRPGEVDRGCGVSSEKKRIIEAITAVIKESESAFAMAKNLNYYSIMGEFQAYIQGLKHAVVTIECLESEGGES